jgi:hypothetical protein
MIDRDAYGFRSDHGGFVSARGVSHISREARFTGSECNQFAIKNKRCG